MNEQALIVCAETGVSLTKDAEALKADALEACALIFKVDSPETNARAVDAQKKLALVRKRIENDRVMVKKPLIDLGRAVDLAAKTFLVEVDEEESRLAEIVGAFLEKERVRQAAELQLQNTALDRLDRELNEKLTCAESIEEQDRIREEYSEKRRMTSTAIPAAPQAKGQVGKSDWDITVVDLHELYRCHANCVELKPRLTEIKALLDAGAQVRGVAAKRVVRAQVRVRTPKEQPPIET